MNIGIILYSHTGNTLSVGEKIRDPVLNRAIRAAKNAFTLENDDPNSKAPLRLVSAPDISGYDAVIFGAPVHAFSLCHAMKAYLSQLPRIEGKRSAAMSPNSSRNRGWAETGR